MAARLRGASLLLVEVPPEPRSSSEPKRPFEVTAKVVFSRSILLEKHVKKESGGGEEKKEGEGEEFCIYLDNNVSFCSSKISSF